MIEQNSVEFSFFLLEGSKKSTRYQSPLFLYRIAMIHKFIIEKWNWLDFFVQYPPVSLLVYVQGLDRLAWKCALTGRQLTSRASAVGILAGRGRCGTICFVSLLDELLTSLDVLIVSFLRYLNHTRFIK